jgi:RecB family exonuclease
VTKTQNPTELAHAMLSPSSAGRWMNCPPSVKLSQTFPIEPVSKAAEMGSIGHKLAEIKTKAFLINIDKYKSNSDQASQMECIKEILADPNYDESLNEMADDVLNQHIKPLIAEASKHEIWEVFLEQRLDLSSFIPQSHGTADVVILFDKTLIVLDHKFGSMRVSAENNPQLMIYGLGALAKFDMLFDIEKVKLIITQPRLDSYDEWEVSVQDLLDWKIKDLMPVAKQAFLGEGNFNPGSWCHFCPARQTCRARSEYSLEIARHDFKEPALLTDEEITSALRRIDQLVNWASDIKEYALSRAVTEGKIWRGMKVVEGRTQRKFSDEDLVASRLNSNGYSFDDISEHKLLGLTKLEKIVGKKRFTELVGDLLTKPPGKPQLALDSDKRPEYNPASNPEADFSKFK